MSQDIQYGKLQAQYRVQVAVAAETSATSRTQTIFQAKIHKTYSRISYSVPAPEKRERSDGAVSPRGQATKVSVMTPLPIRKAQGTLPIATQQTSRLLHSILPIGHVQLHFFFVLYACTPGGPSKSNRN